MRPTVADLLADVGDYPNVLVLVRSFGPRLESAGQFAMTEAGDWQPDPSGHYLSGSPTLRFVRQHDTRQRVRIALASEWFGTVPEGTSTTAMVAALNATEAALKAAFDPGVILWTSPVATGRALWRRTIPKGTEYNVLGHEHTELVRSTTQQGRNEMLGCIRCNGGGCADCPTEAPALFELDARLAYGAIALGELPHRVIAHDAEAWTPETAYDLARYRVRVTVPDGWRHVGLLGVNEKGWRYPRQPGETFETWADGAELLVAAKYGWPFWTLERLAFDRCRPLRTWATKLLGAASSATEPLVRAALRAVLLSTLGGFAQGPVMVTRTGAADQTMPPANARRIQHVGDRLTWQEPGSSKGSTPFYQWAAAIWARQRARLLDTGKTGALHLEPEHVVAFRTDAVWSTVAPSWPDDGAAGRYRVKQAAGASAWPYTVRELLDTKGR